MTESVVILPGAGSGGLAWGDVATYFDASILPLPDVPSVTRMADELVDHIRPLPRVVLVGASLGAMVALELARRTRVHALVLVAAGWGIQVSDRLLDRISSGGPSLICDLAAAGLAPSASPEHIQRRVEDFQSRDSDTLLRHLTALRDYVPGSLAEPPATLVCWGESDRSVPLEDHVELAVRMHGALVPMTSCGHSPYLERPALMAHWIRRACSAPTRR